MPTLGFFNTGMELVQSWEGVAERFVLLLLTVVVYRS
jgi:hypothetical protein